MRLRHIKGCEDFIKESKECFEMEDATLNKGNWQGIFGNQNPIHIEVGMGKGQFIRTLALKNPHINYIGIEKYQTVLMKAIQRKRVMEKEAGVLPNLIYICADARELLDIFKEGEVKRIYLNFSDPWPKERNANRRLTSHTFLHIYEKILQTGGRIEFKTDNTGLFDFSIESIRTYGWDLAYHSYDFHADALAKDNIMTEYEEKFSKNGNKIHKLVVEL